jgi:hypothetical protein
MRFALMIKSWNLFREDEEVLMREFRWSQGGVTQNRSHAPRVRVWGSQGGSCESSSRVRAEWVAPTAKSVIGTGARCSEDGCPGAFNVQRLSIAGGGLGDL